jgi:hypothetical protein
VSIGKGHSSVIGGIEAKEQKKPMGNKKPQQRPTIIKPSDKLPTPPELDSEPKQIKGDQIDELSLEQKEKDHPPQAEQPGDDPQEPVKQEAKSETGNYSNKYKKIPKYKTHVAHNVRIPKELRKEMEQIGRKLGVPINKNSGFFQEFTIDALWKHVADVKKEEGIE